MTTLRDLPVPGRLLVNYFDGRRERYLHPLRLLLLSSLLCFAVGRLVSGGDPAIVTMGESEPIDAVALRARFLETVADEGPEGTKSFHVNPETSGVSLRAAQALRSEIGAGDVTLAPAAVIRLDTLIARVGRYHAAGRSERVFGVDGGRDLVALMSNVDRVRMRLYARERMSALADSARANYFADDAPGRVVLDSFVAAFPAPTTDPLPQELLFGERPELSLREMVTIPAEHLAKASGLQSPINRLIYTKLARVFQDGEAGIEQALYANLSWAVLLFVPLLALGSWALYRRRLPYYSQHLALAAVTMSAALILLAIGFTVVAAGLPWEWPARGLGLVLIGYVLVTERRVFRQGWGAIVLKSVVLGVFSIAAFALSMMAWLLLTLLLA